MKVTNLNLKTKKEFRQFFSSIPDEHWICGSLQGPAERPETHCALGHLGVYQAQNSGAYIYPTRQVVRNVKRLARIFDKNAYEVYRDSESKDLDDCASIVYGVNDASRTAKQNVLNALK